MVDESEFPKAYTKPQARVSPTAPPMTVKPVSRFSGFGSRSLSSYRSEVRSKIVRNRFSNANAVRRGVGKRARRRRGYRQPMRPPPSLIGALGSGIRW